MQDHLKTYRRARRRGSVLLVVFACMALLLTIVAGLHHRQSSARSTLLHEEANLQARIAAEYEMAKWVSPEASFSPLKQAVTAKMEHATALDVPLDVARNLFAEQGLTDLSKSQALAFSPEIQARAGCSWNEVQPTSSDAGLKPDKAEFIGVVSEYFPYVAYAPHGSVQAHETFGWRNQAFDKALFPPDKAHSGEAVRIAAKGDVTLKSCPYGEIYSAEGKISVDAGVFTGWRGLPPNLAAASGLYTSRLREQLRDARQALTSSAQDKTPLLNGQPLTADLMWSVLTGDSQALGSPLSLRQAIRSPLPLIPGGEMVGNVLHLWFHVPSPPDDKSLTEQLKSVDPSRLPTLFAAVDAPPDPGPATRLADQRAGTTSEGPEGWAYAPILRKTWPNLKSMAPPNFSGLHKLFVNEARLVHFGAPDNATNFQISGEAVELTATFNVPAGRSLRLDTNVTIRGDLWLQRGSTLVVDGNLNVLSPLSSPSADPRLPQGKIFLEEGANLVVGGDLNCQGNARVGSVLVGAPYKKIHPVMGSILVEGNINIPFAVLPAFSLSDVDSGIPSLKAFYALLCNVVPNLAKVDGPFHPRQAFFARYASSFQVATVPTPLGPALVPTFIPTGTPKNVQNPIFRTLALIYATHMNMAWGENFVTHTDWWFPGQQVVPMYPKVDPDGLLERLTSLQWPAMPGEKQTAGMVTEDGRTFVTEMVPELLQRVITTLVGQQLGLVSRGVADFGSTLLPLDEWFARLAQVDAVQRPISEWGGLTGLSSEVQRKIQDLDSVSMMHETPGLLLYAGKNLSVACGGEAPPLTVGMLVANNDIRSNAKMTVGAALSFEGSIRCRNLLYDPSVTRCSLYVPRSAPSSTPTEVAWLDWALETAYGGDFSSDKSMPVGPAVPHLTLQGWKQP